MPPSGPASPERSEQLASELDVAEDMQFQRRWWRFEQIMWIFFVGILAVDLSGLMGQGPLARAHAKTADRTIEVNYDRIERFGTNSTLTVKFRPSAVRNGKVQLWVSDSVLRQLGAKRVIPAPETSLISNGGILYTWPAASNPDFASFALNPKNVGATSFTLVLPATGAQIHRGIFVMP